MIVHLVHVAGVLSFAYAIWFQVFMVNMPESISPRRSSFGGVLKYLTFWNLIVQFVYFSVCLINSVIGTRATTYRRSSKIQILRDQLFATVAFPIGIFVGVVFWAIFAVNRELIFPERFDAYIPPYVNHLLHTTVLPLQILELCLQFHVYPQRKKGMLVTASFCLSYLLWICVIAYLGGFWVYPILNRINPMQRSLFISCCGVGGAGLYVLGEKCNKMIWERHVKTQ